MNQPTHIYRRESCEDAVSIGDEGLRIYIA